MSNNQDSPLHRFDESEKLRHDFGDYPLVPDLLFDADWITNYDFGSPTARDIFTVAECSGVSAATNNEREYVELISKREEG